MVQKTSTSHRFQLAFWREAGVPGGQSLDTEGSPGNPKRFLTLWNFHFWSTHDFEGTRFLPLQVF
jgi:hypothetical protein